MTKILQTPLMLSSIWQKLHLDVTVNVVNRVKIVIIVTAVVIICSNSCHLAFLVASISILVWVVCQLQSILHVSFSMRWCLMAFVGVLVVVKAAYGNVILVGNAVKIFLITSVIVVIQLLRTVNIAVVKLSPAAKDLILLATIVRVVLNVFNYVATFVVVVKTVANVVVMMI